MADIESYRLIAYDTVGTMQQVLNWPNYPATRPRVGDILKNGDVKWKVVALRPDSTDLEVKVDVKRVK